MFCNIMIKSQSFNGPVSLEYKLHKCFFPSYPLQVRQEGQRRMEQDKALVKFSPVEEAFVTENDLGISHDGCYKNQVGFLDGFFKTSPLLPPGVSHSHAYPHSSFSNSSTLPVQYSYQFMAPETPAPGKLISATPFWICLFL